MNDGENSGGGESFTPDIVVSDDGGFDVASLRELSNDDPVLESRDVEETPTDETQENDDVLDTEPGQESDSDSDPDLAAQDDDSDRSERDDTEADRDTERASENEKSVTYTDSEGKEHSISAEAEFTIKVDGKKETLTLQDALNTASAGINFQRKNSELGRQRKKFEEDQHNFSEERKRVAEVAERIMGTEDPYDFAYLMGELNGEDGDAIFNKMVQSTVDHMRRYANMSEREKQLEKENRKYRFDQTRREAQEKVANETRAAEEKRAQVTQDLGDAGFTMDDFHSAIDEIRELSQKGEELGFGLDEVKDITEDDIISWMVDKDVFERLETAITEVNPDALDDNQFIERARRVLHRTEVSHGKFSESEVLQFVQNALQQEGKAIRESLSRKDQQRPKSKRASSHKQDEDNDFASVEDLLNNRRSNIPLS